MATLLDKQKLAGGNLTLQEYQKILEKDLARMSRTGKWEDFVLVSDYKFGSKKSTLLIFVGETEKGWEDALQTAKANGKKSSHGLIKAIPRPDNDDNGKDDLHLVLKNVKGDLNKDKAVEAIQSELFPNDPDVEVKTVEQAAEYAELETSEDETSKKLSDQLENTKTDKAEALDEKLGEALQGDLEDFREELQKTISGIGGASAFQKDIQTRLGQIKTLLPRAADDEGARNQLANLAGELNTDLKEHTDALLETAQLGESLLKKHQNAFKELVHDKKYETARTQAIEHIQTLHRLHRFAVQAQTVLEDFHIGKEFGSENKQLAEAKERALQQIKRANAAFAALKKVYPAESYADGQALTAVSDTLTAIDIWTNNTPAPLKTEEQIQGMKKLRDLAESSRVAIIQSELKGNQENQQKYQAAVILASSKDLAQWEQAFTAFDELRNSVSPTLAGNIQQMRDALVTKINAAKNQRAAQTILESIKGEVTPESVFDAFMATYRGKIKYEPNGKGNPLFGQTVCNCETISQALGRVLKFAGFTDVKYPVIAENFITSPVDSQWMDPQCPGNINTNDSQRRYFFTKHWVLNVGGQQFCPTSGRKGSGAIAQTIWQRTQNATNATIGEKEFKELEGAAIEENGGFRYKFF